MVLANNRKDGSRMRRYALRYLTLIVLFLILLPLHNYLPDWSVKNNETSDTNTNTNTQNNLTISPSSFTPGSALYGIVMPSPQEAWAVGGTFQLETEEHEQRVVPKSGLMLHYQNGSWLAGASFDEPLLSVSMSSPQDGWAVGYAGELVHYNGKIWQALSSPTNAILCSIVMLSADDGWATGYGGMILHFHNHQWEIVPSPTNADLLSLKMVSAQDGWVVGSNGTILHYNQGQWKTFNSPTTQTLNDVSFLSAHEGWAVGDQGTILHYRDGVWSPVQLLSGSGYGEDTLLNVAVTSEQTGWIVGKQVMLTYNQEVWQVQNPVEAYQTWYALVMNTPNNGWAVGDNNSIYHYQSGIWHFVSLNQ
jgi:photosystem II stability/assembly factor-like uncharacterized protein